MTDDLKLRFPRFPLNPRMVRPCRRMFVLGMKLLPMLPEMTLRGQGALEAVNLSIEQPQGEAAGKVQDQPPQPQTVPDHAFYAVIVHHV